MIEEVFNENKGRYGSRRIKLVLEHQNIVVNVRRISKLMITHGLVAKGTRKAYKYYPNKTRYEEKDNILNQVFSTRERNKVWVGDITYIPTKHGFYIFQYLLIYSLEKLLAGRWIKI